MTNIKKHISRRGFLKLMGGTAAAATASLTGCKDKDLSTEDDYRNQVEPPKGKMTFRTDPKTGQKVSILAYGMMRLPSEERGSARENTSSPIDQEQVNRLVDYAIEHGVNYFDTSPMYCQGMSERATGIALSRHPRSSYLIATKMSNFAAENQTREKSIEMFENSLKELQTDYIDYYLLHMIGGSGMEEFRRRFIYNGILDWLLEQREKGRIRHLGFSYHGDVSVYDYLLANNDKYRWDFAMIELNYLDWKHAKDINDQNTNAEYLYNELDKRQIPVMVMEPLLGGRLSNVPEPIAVEIKRRAPEKTVASWAFRYAASKPRVLTVLSGMTYMEHLKDNLLTYSPLVPLNEEEENFLEQVAKKILTFTLIPCNDCKYCMPCPYGVDIPGVLLHYNLVKSEERLPEDRRHPDYARYRREFIIGQNRAVDEERQANHCIGCGQCVPHCPQRIDIPARLHEIDNFVERLKQEL